MMISSHLKGFWEIQKNWSFRWPRTWRKMWFLDISHFCRFCSQMSELLHLRCPDVILWWFPAILRAFEKFKKIEVFDDRGPGEKCDFWTFSHFCRFCSQMSELLHLRCPDVILWWFPAILRAFEKFKKIEVFDDRGPGEKCDFWTFHTFADFAAKWVNYYIWGVLMSYYDDFQPF